MATLLFSQKRENTPFLRVMKHFSFQCLEKRTPNCIYFFRTLEADSIEFSALVMQEPIFFQGLEKNRRNVSKLWKKALLGFQTLENSPPLNHLIFQGLERFLRKILNHF